MTDPELLVLDVHGVVLSNPLPEFLGRVADLTGQKREVIRTIVETVLGALVLWK